MTRTSSSPTSHPVSRLLAAVLAMSGAAAAVAQQPAGGLGLDQIIVTAQKREEKLQDVPIAVAAFTPEAIERAGGTNITTINGIAPNIILQTEGLVPNVPIFAIRGIQHSDPDPNSDPKISTVIDGVYVPFAAASMLDMFDIERVEILRGPQGTLFGKNNIGGTISVTSARPTGEFGGMLSVTAGENGLQHYKFKVNSPAFGPDEMFSAKLAGAYREYDGYATNIVTGSELNGQEVKSWRGALLFQPSENFDSTLIVDYTDDTTDGPAGHSVGIPAISGQPYKAALDLDPRTTTETMGVTLDNNWDVLGGTFTAVLGHRDLEYVNIGDYDGRTGTPAFTHVIRDFDGDAQSVELRYAAAWGERLDYVVGLYYSQDDWQQINTVDVTATTRSLSVNKQDGSSYAGFAQVDFHATEALTLTLGGRYTKDEKDYSLNSRTLNPVTGTPIGSPFSVNPNDDWSNFSPRVALQYTISDDIMTYASVAKGYKGGGYNSRATLPELVGPYDEETATSYEIGLKSDWLDDRLRVNGAVFYTEYEDLQLGVLRPGALRAESVTTNVGEAEVAGFELEITVVPVENLRLGLNYGYLNADYKKWCDDTNGVSAYFPSPCGGIEQQITTPVTLPPNNWLIGEDQTHLDMASAPDSSASVVVDYDLPLGAAGLISFHADGRYTDKYNTWGRNNDPDFYRDDVWLFNAHVSYSDVDDVYRVTLYGRNLTDKEVMSGAVATGTNPITQFYQPPREWGAEFIYNF